MPLAKEFVEGGEQAKVLEIGLGCGQSNVGAGVRMWDMLFANNRSKQLTLHVLEYDIACAAFWKARWAHQFKHLNLTIFTGDQGEVATHHRVKREGGGDYDAIVDDGGHTMHHQQTSLRHLFPLLKSRGWYAIEDIQTSFMPHYTGGTLRTTTKMLGDMIGWLSGDPSENTTLTHQFAKILPLIEHQDCYTEMCVLQRYP